MTHKYIHNQKTTFVANLGNIIVMFDDTLVIELGKIPDLNDTTTIAKLAVVSNEIVACNNESIFKCDIVNNNNDKLSM